jgi:flagellar biogenesis protein FliO
MSAQFSRRIDAFFGLIIAVILVTYLSGLVRRLYANLRLRITDAVKKLRQLILGPR